MLRAYSRVSVYETLLYALAVSPEVKELVDDAAEAGADAARDRAPVNTGEYRDSLRAFPAELRAGRWVGSFGSTSHDWHFVEYGTATNQPYRTLTDAAESLGIEYRPE